MKLLLKNATIFDPGNKLHLRSSDILIDDGRVVSVKENISAPADESFDCTGAHISAGWVDAMADFGEPGHEYRETFESGAAAAAAGGFTDVILFPNGKPDRDNAAAISFVAHRSERLPVTLHAIGAVTEHTEGKKLAEMYDMHAVGAVAFSDGLKSIGNAGVMMQALEYVKANNALLVQIPTDREIAGAGLMNESPLSSTLGLPGSPAIAEELITQRDIELLRYTGSRLHIAGVSTAKNLAQIKAAKAEGLNITCSVQAAHLLFTEESLADYDTVFKVTPPLRSASDKEAMVAGVNEGTIDAVFSHHLPRNIDEKETEFQTAAEGMAMIQYTAQSLLTAGISEEAMIRSLTAGRKIFGVESGSAFTEGSQATFTIYETSGFGKISKELNRSLSGNHPFEGKTLKGKVIAIVNKGKLFKQ